MLPLNNFPSTEAMLLAVWVLIGGKVNTVEAFLEKRTFIFSSAEILCFREIGIQEGPNLKVRRHPGERGNPRLIKAEAKLLVLKCFVMLRMPELA